MAASTAKPPLLEVEHRENRSLRMFLLQHAIKATFGTRLVKPGKPQPAGSLDLQPPNAASKGFAINKRVLHEINVYDIEPTTRTNHAHGKNAPKRRRIYYFAGGGFQSPPSSEHWKFCIFLAREMNLGEIHTIVSIVSYPLAPSNPSSVVIPWLLAFYHHIVPPLDSTNSNEEIILAGDSSGGNIVLSITLEILTAQPESRPPDKLLLISPAVDLRHGNAEMKVVDRHDPILSIKFVKSIAKTWHEGSNLTLASPLMSPTLGRLRLLSRSGIEVYGVLGGYDVLTPDATHFRKLLQDYRVKGKWLEWDKQMHCFPLASCYKILPESNEAARWIVKVLQESTNEILSKRAGNAH